MQAGTIAKEKATLVFPAYAAPVFLSRSTIRLMRVLVASDTQKSLDACGTHPLSWLKTTILVPTSVVQSLYGGPVL